MSFIVKRYVIIILAFIGMAHLLLLKDNLLLVSYMLATQDTHLADLNFADSVHNIGWEFACFAGVLVTRYDGASTFGITIALSAIANLLAPFAMNIAYWLYTLIRLLDGIFQAFPICALLDICSRWSTPEERSRFMTISYCGIFFGFIISVKVLPHVKPAASMLHFFGFSSLIWAAAWLLIVKNDPIDDKLLSDSEKQHLISKNVALGSREREQLSTYPWKSILTSRPLWMLIITSYFLELGTHYSTVLTPFYISGDNDWLVEIVTLLPMLSLPCLGCVADFQEKWKRYSSTQIRKSYICIGFIIGALSLVLLFFKQLFSTPFFLVSQFSRCIVLTSVLVNAIDLSPRYAALLYGIVETFNAFVIITFPVVMKQFSNANLWKNGLIWIMILYILSALLYSNWGSAEVQSWNTTHKERYELQKRDNNEA